MVFGLYVLAKSGDTGTQLLQICQRGLHTDQYVAGELKGSRHILSEGEAATAEIKVCTEVDTRSSRSSELGPLQHVE